MAVLTVYNPLPFSPGVGTVTVNTPTQVTIVAGQFEQNYYGSGFTYSASGVTGGVVTDSNLRYTALPNYYYYGVTGLNHSASVVASFVLNGDSFGLMSFVFNGNDTMYGSDGGSDQLSGYGGTNLIFGLGGNDSLFGGVNFFADTLYGGAGDDYYELTNGIPVILENPGEGIDTIRTYIPGLTLPNHVENLFLDANVQIGIGNASANRIVGNAVGNMLQGMGGNDTLQGDYGADTLDGGEGVDWLQGGLLDTVFVIDNPLDVMTDVNNFLGDTVVVLYEGYTLQSNINNLVLGGSVRSGQGNGNGNSIVGNSSGNIIDGGGGADTLTGGGGNDVYLIDQSGDVVVEFSDQGLDTIQTQISYDLPGELENLRLIGSGNVNGNGNSVSNIISGNAGNNQLNGGGGADIIAGGAGDDTYIIDNPGDLVMELGGSGHDTVQTTVTYNMMQSWHVENMVLYLGAINGYGNWLDNHISGSSSQNVIDGGRGNDTISGWFGSDTLLGGTGDDVLIWDPLDSMILGGTGIDTLLVEDSGNVLNLTALADSLITDVEVIDLTGSGNNTLTLGLTDLLAISSSTDTLTIDGNTGDSVNLQGTWNNAGGTGYTTYVQGQATILIDTDITVAFI